MFEKIKNFEFSSAEAKKFISLISEKLKNFDISATWLNKFLSYISENAKNIEALTTRISKVTLSAILLGVLGFVVIRSLWEGWADIQRISISEIHIPKKLAEQGMSSSGFVEKIKKELEIIEALSQSDIEKIDDLKDYNINPKEFDVSIPGTTASLGEILSQFLKINQAKIVFHDIIEKASSYQVNVAISGKDAHNVANLDQSDLAYSQQEAARRSAEKVALEIVGEEELVRVQLAIGRRNIGRRPRDSDWESGKKLLEDLITSKVFLIEDFDLRQKYSAIAYKYLGDLHYNEGLYLEKEEERENAKQKYTEAIERYELSIDNIKELRLVDNNIKGLWLAKNGLAKAYRRLCDYQQAKQNLDEIVENRPEYVSAQAQLGLLYKWQAFDLEMKETGAGRSKMKEAYAQFSLVEERRPNISTSHYNLGVAHLGLGETNDANEAFREAKRLHLSDDELGNVEWLYATCKLGRLDPHSEDCADATLWETKTPCTGG